MHRFNISHPTLTFQNSEFGRFFKVMQTMHLESAMWDRDMKVLIIILPPYNHIRLFTYACKYLIFAILRSQETIYILLETNLSIKNTIKD